MSKLSLLLQKALPNMPIKSSAQFLLPTLALKSPKSKTLPFEWNVQISSSSELNLSVHICLTLP